LEHSPDTLIGDLNFTKGVDEVWGVVTQLDKLADYFKSMIQDHHLVDLILDEVIPTWQNGILGVLKNDWIEFWSRIDY
jgi:hypothetical protein